MQFFVDLVDRFYKGVDQDPVIRSMYPHDLTESKQDLSLFLAQYWGGPTTYSDGKGHPRLRMRHVNFRIREPERDAWLGHMKAAVLAAELDPESETAMLEYFDMAANHMINAE